MSKYDESVLQSYADRLYRRATWIVMKYAIGGLITGFTLGYVPALAWYFRDKEIIPPTVNMPALFLAALCAVIFSFVGEGKAFRLKLEAQQTLCQMQIERNTRRASV